MGHVHVGAALCLGIFNFEISLGIEVKLLDMMEILSDEDDSKPGTVHPICHTMPVIVMCLYS
jgi:hypothetical protein